MRANAIDAMLYRNLALHHIEIRVVLAYRNSCARQPGLDGHQKILTIQHISSHLLNTEILSKPANRFLAHLNNCFAAKAYMHARDCVTGREASQLVAKLRATLQIETASPAAHDLFAEV